MGGTLGTPISIPMVLTAGVGGDHILDQDARRPGAARAVRDWLAAHPRVAIHYTPTYSPWLNQVELWFAKIETQSYRQHEANLRSCGLRRPGVAFGDPTRVPRTLGVGLLI